MPFVYRNNRLGLEQGERFTDLVGLAQLAKRPAYVYDLDGMIERLRTVKASLPSNAAVHYAMKANHNAQLLKGFVRENVGVDVVSGGELDLALEAGFKPDKIVFSGVGKSRSEIERAVALNIAQINVESPQELERIAEVARAQGRTARVAFRMNPDVNPVTHPYIRTGFRENKFGMDESFLPELKTLLLRYPQQLQLVGLTLHIGSQIRNLEPMLEAVDKTIPIYNELRAEGFPLETFDVGGGLGINYEEPDWLEEKSRIEAYGRALGQKISSIGARLLTEPGRIIVAECGVLLAEVQYVKKTPYKNFLIVSTGMHHLLRPSLYQAFHRVQPVELKAERAPVLYDVVGPICESADVLGHDRLLPETRPGEWIAIREAGAYGAVMASGYNSHEPPLEKVISEGQVLA